DEFKRVELASKSLIGYADLKNNLPFNLIEYYFYFNDDLAKSYDLILLENLKDIPDNIDKVIINADKSYSDKHT
ncbi:MAG: hypothetical protein GTO02_13135, partial [Candidatus Dadabacteria bacterium]|nr:hypothetical protein [Candidatus Dadabacteria bacterium]